MNSNSSSDGSPYPPDSPSTTNNVSSGTSTLLSMMEEGVSPKVLLSHLAPSLHIPPDADEMMLWRLFVSMIDPPKRKKLPELNTIEDAVNLISKSKKIVVLSGAGISTSAGLPDFRSRNGIYVQIHAEHPDLNDPKYMFDIQYFRKNPLPFYQFAKALYPGQYKPTIGHKFIKILEEHDKLLRNYSQNIDTLEKQAGIKHVVECHGSFSSATCTNCKYSVDGEVIKGDILDQRVPKCPQCHGPGTEPDDGLGLMKPNIVFFGEQLGDLFHKSLELDKEHLDLLIVIGSSLKVRPVALIPKSIPAHVPQILINKEPLDHMNFDIELLGNCDSIIQELCLRLGEGWTHICEPDTARLIELHTLPHGNSTESFSFPHHNTSETIASGEAVPSKVLNPERKEQIDENIDHKIDDVSTHRAPELEIKESSNSENQESDLHSDRAGQNMIEESHGPRDDMKLDNKSAISDCDGSSSDDWEDIEVLHSSDSSSNDSSDLAEIQIPRNSFFFLKPNRYLFFGSELTRAQFERYTIKSLTTDDHRNL